MTRLLRLESYIYGRIDAHDDAALRAFSGRTHPRYELGRKVYEITLVCELLRPFRGGTLTWYSHRKVVSTGNCASG